MSGSRKTMLARALAVMLVVAAAGQIFDSRTGKKCADATRGDDCVLLTCIDAKCTPCRSDAECDSSSLVCSGAGTTTTPGSLWLAEPDSGVTTPGTNSTTGGRCVHKPLFPMDKWDWITLVLVILACILAASGGIGGGGLLVPLYILVSGFAANSASPLSSATITGGGIANYYSYSTRYHPNFDDGVQKPLIDYDTALLFMPALLLGTLYGTILNKVLPEWLFLALMFILMCKYSVRTANKGRRLFKKETEERNAAKGAAGNTAPVVAAAEPSADGKADTAPTAIVPVAPNQAVLDGSSDDPTAKDDEAARAAARAKVNLFPRKQLLITVGAWVLTFLIALFKGKAGSASAIGVTCNTGGFWAVIIVGTVLLVALTALIRMVVLQGIAESGASGDIKWDAKNTIKYPAVCVLCGVMAGLMGIGGGMVIGPLLIELGVVPQVVAATSAYTVIITASSATVQFMVMGSLQYDYGAFFAAVGLVTTFAGQFFVDRMIKKYNRASVIVFAIATIMVIATVLLGYTGVAKVIRQVDNDSSLGLRPLCD